MKKQKITVHNMGDQDATVDMVLNLAELGFTIKCAMLEHASVLECEREFAEYEPAEEEPVIH